MNTEFFSRDIYNLIASFSDVLSLIRMRRVSRVWKDIVSNIRQIVTKEEIEGNLLTYFPLLELYCGPINNLRDLVVDSKSRLLSLNLSLDDSHSASLFFAIIRDYYKVGLQTKLIANIFVNPRRGFFNFNQGLFTLDKWSVDVRDYAAVIGKQSEIHVRDGNDPFCVTAKHIIYHAPPHGAMATAWMTDLISYENIEQLTIHLTDDQLNQLKSWMPEHLMKKVRFIVGEVDPNAPRVFSINKHNGRACKMLMTQRVHDALEGAIDPKTLTGKDELKQFRRAKILMKSD